MPSRTLQIIVACCLVAVAAPAAAQDKAAAETAFAAGRALLAEGRVAEACEKLALSQRLDPAVGTLLNLADCREREGKLASAWADFKEAAARAGRLGQARRQAEAERRVALLEPRLTRLRVTARGERAEGLAVLRDGQDITSLLDVAVPIDAGTYHIEARAPGHAPWARQVTVAGEGARIVVEVPVLAPTPALAAREAALEAGLLDADTGARDRRPSTRRRVVALGTGASGVLALGTGLVLYLQAGSRLDRARELCGAELACPDEDSLADARALTDSARLRRNLSYAFVGVGAAALAGGVVLWATSPKSSRQVDLSAQAGADGFGLVATGRF